MTQITTLEQAEIALYRANAVQQYNEQPMVEGSRLIEACGFSSVNPRRVLSEQVERHSLVEGRDFIRTEDRTYQLPGRKPVIWRFTVNAANHILLAAMTPQGYEARQVAINTQQQVNNRPLTQMEQLQIIVNSAVENERRLSLLEQEVAQSVEDHNLRLETVEHRLDTRSTKVGYILRSDARNQYCPNLSDAIVKSVIHLKAVPKEYQLMNVNGFETQAMIVQEQCFEAAIAEFLSEAVKVTPLFYTHPSLEGKRFKI